MLTSEKREAGELRAYFDRSELKNAGVMAVGGFMTPVRTWRQFERKWREVMDRHGIETFHMTDFETRQGKYASWSAEQRKRLVRQMVGVLRRHASVCVAVAIVTKDYRALKDSEQRALGHPYALCGLKAVADTLRWMDGQLEEVKSSGRYHVLDKAYDLRTEFVFEAGDEGAGELDAALRREKESGVHGRRIWSWTFAEKANSGAIQAADFAAYETTKQMVRTIAVDPRDVRKSMSRLVSRVRFVGQYINEQSLRELLSLIERRCEGDRL